MGYRHFDKYDIEPLYEFGFGLSYTTFDYSDLKLSTEKMEQGDTLEISLTVKNTGKVDGDEVIQLYISDKKASVEREVKSLKGLFGSSSDFRFMFCSCSSLFNFGDCSVSMVCFGSGVNFLFILI